MRKIKKNEQKEMRKHFQKWEIVSTTDWYSIRERETQTNVKKDLERQTIQGIEKKKRYR